MIRYFADTFYYLALLSDRDQAHEIAVALNSGLEGGIVTTQWVLAEVGDALAAPEVRPLFTDLMAILEEDPDTVVVEADSDLFAKAVALFNQRPDKWWSLTDCTSFVVMEEMQLHEALTGDHHFEQAGFTALLK